MFSSRRAAMKARYSIIVGERRTKSPTRVLTETSSIFGSGYFARHSATTAASSTSVMFYLRRGRYHGVTLPSGHREQGVQVERTRKPVPHDGAGDVEAERALTRVLADLVLALLFAKEAHERVEVGGD